MVCRYMIVCVVLVLLGGGAAVEARQPGEGEAEKASLRVVVDPGGAEIYSLALSGDGRTVVGTVAGLFGQAFVWTEAGGLATLPSPEWGRFVRIDGVSRDGSRAVGYGMMDWEKNAFLWESGKGTRALGHLEADVEMDQTEALAISGDGRVVVGISQRRPFLWTEEEGMRDLDAGLRNFTYPEALSGDGSVVAGRLLDPDSKMHRAFRWSEGEGMQFLGEVRKIEGGGNVHSFPSAVSRDGRVIVGHHMVPGVDDPSSQHAFRWTAEEGMVDLGALPGWVDHSIAKAVNADGTVIVGSSAEAFIWDAANGMRSLKQALQEAGVDVEGWRLRRAVGVSDDGTRIVGYGYAPGRDEEIAFLATLPAEAFGDDGP